MATLEARRAELADEARRIREAVQKAQVHLLRLQGAIAVLDELIGADAQGGASDGA